MRLKNEEWRLNFEQLLDICAVEEVDLAELLQGWVVASPCAARLGPRYLQRISDAAGRLRPAIREAQIPLPLQGD